MEPEDLFNFIDAIPSNDDAALDSDLGGDSDAEDGKVVMVRLSRPSTSKTIFQNSDSENKSDNDFDSDDSIVDPHFSPEEYVRISTDIIDPESDSSTSNEEDLAKKVRKLDGKKKNEKHTSVIEDKDYNFDWKVGMGNEPKAFTNSTFTQVCGPLIELDFESPLAIFNYFFDDNLMQMIVDESNKYAQQTKIILDLSITELRAFFGICIIMGFHKLPSIRMYWCSDPNLQVDRISGIMTLKRFLKILRYIHLNENLSMPMKGEAEFDRLYKIRPLITHLNTKFQSAFSPSRYLSIDESMVRFNGRSTLKQYMPKTDKKRV